MIIVATLSLQTSAQSIFTIKGKIFDAEKEQLEFGEVILREVKDSSMIKGGLINKGSFVVEGVPNDFHLLEFRATGYESKFYSLSKYREVIDEGPTRRNYKVNDSIDFLDGDIESSIFYLQDSTEPPHPPYLGAKLDGDIIWLNDVSLKAIETLEGAEVVHFKPTFRRDGDKVIVDVEGSAMASSGSVIDLLRKSPGVLVDGQNNISIFGRGAARVYIDGQLIASNNVLQTISSEEVKEVEVIKNPGAEYDAEGKGGVINIITKNANLEGYSGVLYVSGAQGMSYFSSAGGNFNYKKGKVAVLGAGNWFYGTRGSTSDYYRTIFDPAGNQYFDNALTNALDINNWNVRLGIDYSIDSLSSIGFQWKSIHDNVQTTTANINDLLDSNLNSIQRLVTATNRHALMSNNGFNLHYKFRDDSTGVNWNTSVDYTRYTSKDQGEITENPDDTGGADHERLSTGTNGISLLTGKIDYNKKINDHWKFSLGAKYYGISNNSNMLFQELIGSNWISDTSLTTGFNFAEGVGALYAQTVYKKKKFNMRLGLRGERTQTAGTSSLTNENVIDTAYMNLFPTAYFGYKFSKDLVLGLNYTSRFNRPRFQDLNPFVEYLDSVSAFIGNPLLLPEYSHSARASLTYMEYASIEIGYTRTPKERLTMVERNLITNGFLVQDQNINWGESFNIDLTLPYQTKKWTTYNGIGYAYTTYNFNDPGTGELREISVPSFNWYLYNELQLPWDFSIQGTFWWTSSGLEGIFEYQKIYGLNATITKKFFDGALTVSLTGNDILSYYIEQGKSKLEGFEVQYQDRYDTHFWQLRLRYSFGKLKGFDAKDKAGNREETGRIK